MNTPNETESTNLTAGTAEDNASQFSRRSFFRRAAVVGATGLVAAGGVATLASAITKATPSASADAQPSSSGLKPVDRAILVAAQIAEALAVTTYSNIIDNSPFFKRIPKDDQGYLVGARQEEMSHYLLEQSSSPMSSRRSPSFFYPVNMFADAQTTLNTLVTLEDAFIAAYLVGVRDFSPRYRCG